MFHSPTDAAPQFLQKLTPFTSSGTTRNILHLYVLYRVIEPKKYERMSFLYGRPSGLNRYFAPTKIQVMQSALFRQEKQKEGETIAQFVTRLQQLAVFCDFPGESMDSLSKIKSLTMGGGGGGGGANSCNENFPQNSCKATNTFKKACIDPRNYFLP